MGRRSDPQKEVNMKTNTTRYESWGISMGHKLAFTADTLQEMRDAIDESNERAVSLGYKPLQWNIIYVEISREMQGDRFVKGITEETYIETYPEEV